MAHHFHEFLFTHTYFLSVLMISIQFDCPHRSLNPCAIVGGYIIKGIEEVSPSGIVADLLVGNKD